MINKLAWMHTLLKKAWMLIAVLIVVAAVCSSIFRSLTPWATQYKDEVEHHLSQLVGQKITVQSMQTGWYWFQPVLKLEHLTLRGDHDSIHVEKLLVGINLFKSLLHWRIQPGVLYVDDVHLIAKEHAGSWQIAGIAQQPGSDNAFSFDKTQQLLALLAQQERLIIRHASIDMLFSNGRLIPINSLNLSIANKSGTYKIKGTVGIGQNNSTTFELLAELVFDPSRIKDTQGHVYCTAKNVLLAQWQQLFSDSAPRFDEGSGTLSLWFDIRDGSISAAQAHVNFNELVWHMPGVASTEIIHSFYANLAWKPDSKGWKLQADNIKLHMGAVVWPTNQLLVQFDKAQGSYLFFIKSVLIESLLTNAIDWSSLINLASKGLLPESSSIKFRLPDVPQFAGRGHKSYAVPKSKVPVDKKRPSLIEMKPHGVLSDVQILVARTQLNYLLARFDQIGWEAQNSVPKVDKLSGVVQWAPQEGHLELDSENMLVAFKGYPAQKLSLLNAAFDWKELSNGFRLSIDRFALSQPELTLSMQGVIDDLSRSSVGALRLVLEFSAKNLQQWMPYLPKQQMKPKLFLWLNQGIKRIAQATGKVTINGQAKDFPFDNNNGEFSIVSHAIGGELFITPKWQLIKDIEGYIRLKNRNLDIDLVHADFQGVPVHEMNLRIDDIGKDKETLLIHGLVNGQAQKMLHFVLASPLESKLAKLKMLLVKGLLALDLYLEIPLYPENDNNLVKGDVTFKDNRILVKHQMGVFSIDDVSGSLSFNELGVMHSALTATAWDYPLTIKMQSSLLPKPVTSLFVNGECTVESLKSQFKLPVLSFLRGKFFVNAVLNISADPNDLDVLTFNSSLQGLAIKLPAPLGKGYLDKAPLKVTVDFNPEKAVRLRADYNSRISSDIWFAKNKQSDFVLRSGQISLGTSHAVDQQTPGLALTGSLDGFDLQEWYKVANDFSSDQSDFSLLNQLRAINVHLNKLTLLNQHFDQLSVKGLIKPNHDWTLIINQKKVAADLSYNAATRLLSGFVHYLHLDKINPPKARVLSMTSIKPEQIPNINVRIDNLSIDKAQIGTLTLKSHSSPEHWVIDYCRIDSPVYQANINGGWIQKEKNNQSTLQVSLHLNNLAKSLARWNISPVVDAGRGDFEFTGGWKGSLMEFSLATLKGAVAIKLKDGRITHLSPETEEKLGLGKLLSILSLQTIPRRLQLDFSDLSHQGYSFDIFKGDFALDHGILNTQNSYIDGPVAYASMKGDLDIVRRMYDLNLSISPHITASIPIVATIAGGPIVGLAAWIASKIINQSMQKITGYSYKISGPWDQPVVQQLSIIKKVIKK